MASFLKTYQGPLSINEGFSAGNMTKAVKLIKKHLERKLGKLYEIDTEEFDNTFGSQVGIKYGIGDTAKAIRFNWEKSGKSTDIASVDIWDNSPNSKPALHIPTKDVSIVRVLPELVKAINTMAKGDIAPTNESVEIKDFPVDMIIEAKISVDGQTFKSQKDAVIHLTKLGMTPEQIVDKTGIKLAAVKFHANTALSVMGGVPETVKVSKSDSAITQQIEELDKVSVEVMYQDLEDLVNMVVADVQPSLIVAGPPGTGKTHTVKKILEDKGMQRGNQWKLIKGQTSPFGLYASLFLNRDKLIVFDDTDAIWKDKVAVNLLKAALDSDDERLISWNSGKTYSPDYPPYEIAEFGGNEAEAQIAYFAAEQKLPNEFLFNGRIIFLSNLGRNELDSAVKNRSYVIDINLTPDDVIRRIKSIIPDFKINGKKVSKTDQNEALGALEEMVESNPKYISIRTFIQFLKTKASGSPRWKDLAMRYTS